MKWKSNYIKFQRQKREKAQAKRQSAAKRVLANKIISDLAKEGKKEKESGKGENSPGINSKRGSRSLEKRSMLTRERKNPKKIKEQRQRKRH